MDRYVVSEKQWDKGGQPTAWGIYDTVRQCDYSDVWFTSLGTANQAATSLNFHSGVGLGNMSRGYFSR
jgi:hypothetical protein